MPRNQHQAIVLVTALNNAIGVAEALEPTFKPRAAKRMQETLSGRRMWFAIVRGNLISLEDGWWALIAKDNVTYIYAPVSGLTDEQVRSLGEVNGVGRYYPLPWADEKRKIAAIAGQVPLPIRRRFFA